MGISLLSTLDYKVQLLDFALLNSKFQACNLMTLNQSLFVLFNVLAASFLGAHFG